MDVVRAWHGREMYLCALTALPLGSCYIHGVISTTFSRLCHDHGTSEPCRRRSHCALNMFCRCLPRPCTFELGSHRVLCTSKDKRINTRFDLSDTHFCFNNSTVNKNSVSNTELLLSQTLISVSTTVQPTRTLYQIQNYYFLRHSLLFQQQYSQHELCIKYRITTVTLSSSRAACSAW